MRRGLLLLVLVLAGCGKSGSTPPIADRTNTGIVPPTTSTATAPSDPGSAGERRAERAIGRAFDDYNRALVARDYAGACRQLAPETVRKLYENLKGRVPNVPKDCDKQLALIYGSVGPTIRQRLEETSRTARLDRVVVDGDTATIDWTARPGGKRVRVTQTARRVGGAWRLVDVSN